MALSSTPRDRGDDAIRVMVVDDSAVIRGLITRTLESDPGVSVVASVGDGKMAINQVGRHTIDVVVLDIEMPVMDGMTALPKILEASPATRVIMASTLTARNADVSLRAMEAGAADYVPKPTSTREISGGTDFKTELLTKVKVFGAQAKRDQRRRQPTGDAPRRFGAAGAPAGGAGRVSSAERAAAPALDILNRGGEVKLRPMPAGLRPEILAIGSSTGGPQALFKVIKAMGKPRVPVVLTQHMPKTFTTILADHITKQTGVEAVEGAVGMPLKPGRIHIAPGDFHMILDGKAGAVTVRLSDAPPENFCRPSVDPMLRSVVKLYGSRVLVAILTGMGQDGLLGCREVVQAGGAVFGQDEATSVVWGMPGAVAVAGLCSKILPVDQFGRELAKTIGS